MQSCRHTCKMHTILNFSFTCNLRKSQRRGVSLLSKRSDQLVTMTTNVFFVKGNLLNSNFKRVLKVFEVRFFAPQAFESTERQALRMYSLR